MSHAALTSLFGMLLNPELQLGRWNASHMSGYPYDRNTGATVTHQSIECGVADPQACDSLFDGQ